MLFVALKSSAGCVLLNKFDLTCNLAASGDIYSNSPTVQSSVIPLEKRSPEKRTRPEHCCCDYTPATHAHVYRYFYTNTHWHTQTVTSARAIRGGFHLVWRGKLDMFSVSLPSLLLSFSHTVVSSTCSFIFLFRTDVFCVMLLHFQSRFFFLLYPDLLTGHLATKISVFIAMLATWLYG